MKLPDSDIDTDYLDLALGELHSETEEQYRQSAKYGALLCIACFVAAGDRKSGIDRLNALVARGEELAGSNELSSPAAEGSPSGARG